MSGISSTVSASKARSDFYSILKQVHSKLRRFTITRRGQAQAVVMHPDEVASWEETMEVMADSKLLQDIAKAERELEVGKLLTEKELLKKFGVSEKDLE